MERVAITGIGVVTCFGDSPEAFHAALCRGEKGVYSLEPNEWTGSNRGPGGMIASFRAEAYLQGKSLRPLDRTGRIVASAAKLALEDSGWTPEMLRQQDVGLVLGTMFSSMHTISAFDRHGLTQGPSYVSPMDFANTVLNAAAGQTAIWHNLRGINSTIAGGTTSGLMALGYASDLIRFGGATALLAGGADEFCLEAWCGFERADLLCKSNGKNDFPIPFSAGRNGFALAEGAALLMLEEWNAAQRRGATILGEIVGHSSSYHPSPGLDGGFKAITRAMNAAVEDSQLLSRDIDCVSASANGSILADRNEALAIHELWSGSADSVPVTAVKSMLGEALGASGALQAIALLQSLRTGMLPGIRGFKHHGSEIPALNFCCREQPLLGRFGLVNSVGIDGNVCSLVISSASNV
jgi:3-oxoacyl-[acyl-carrier-protein] synthase II